MLTFDAQHNSGLFVSSFPDFIMSQAFVEEKRKVNLQSLKHFEPVEGTIFNSRDFTRRQDPRGKGKKANIIAAMTQIAYKFSANSMWVVSLLFIAK